MIYEDTIILDAWRILYYIKSNKIQNLFSEANAGIFFVERMVDYYELELMMLNFNTHYKNLEIEIATITPQLKFLAQEEYHKYANIKKSYYLMGLVASLLEIQVKLINRI